ncbi:hypothetical protein OEZ86_008271 [Tetradesmus obliquus]|nr:hypothetical protein OEZ86_008271 [Tetradesmus obliquus]
MCNRDPTAAGGPGPPVETIAASDNTTLQQAQPPAAAAAAAAAAPLGPESIGSTEACAALHTPAAMTAFKQDHVVWALNFVTALREH